MWTRLRMKADDARHVVRGQVPQGFIGHSKRSWQRGNIIIYDSTNTVLATAQKAE